MLQEVMITTNTAPLTQAETATGANPPGQYAVALYLDPETNQNGGASESMFLTSELLVYSEIKAQIELCLCSSPCAPQCSEPCPALLLSEDHRANQTPAWDEVPIRPGSAPGQQDMKETTSSSPHHSSSTQPWALLVKSQHPN